MYSPVYRLRSFDVLEPPQKVQVLVQLLEGLILANRLYLRAEPRAPGVYEAGLRYQLEAPGTDEWQDIPETLRRRTGDCEDLVAYRVAWLRERHEDIGAVPLITFRMLTDPRTGDLVTLYHVQVMHSDGSVEDPSVRLGMKPPPPEG